MFIQILCMCVVSSLLFTLRYSQFRFVTFLENEIDGSTDVQFYM